MSISKVDHVWAKSAHYDLEKERGKGQEPTFEELVSRFRKTIQKEADNKGSSYTSFATLQGHQQPESSTQPSPSSGPPKSNQLPTPKCKCGDIHWYSECPYINESIRSQDWKPDSKIAKKIDDALKEPKFKAKVERAIKKNKEYQSRKTPSIPTELPTEVDQRAIVATNWQGEANAETETKQAIYTTRTVENYALSNSWILDSGANVHLCNNRTLFESIHPAPNQDVIYAGKTAYPIEAYGRVRVYVTSPTGSVHYITLTDVAYVPGFMTNTVSFSKTLKAQVYWDTKRNTLYTKKNGNQDHFCKLDLIGSQIWAPHVALQVRFYGPIITPWPI